jgi:hypothetical protein
MKKSTSQIVRETLVAAVSAATAASIVAAATPPLAVRPVTSGVAPARATLKLANGQTVELVRRSGVLHGRVLDAKGRVVSEMPAGKLMLATGKEIKFNDRGQLVEGSVPSVAFLLMCDPGPKPPCP